VLGAEQEVTDAERDSHHPTLPGRGAPDKVDTGNFGHLAAPFSIRSVPTLLFIHNGKILDAHERRRDGAPAGAALRRV